MKGESLGGVVKEVLEESAFRDEFGFVNSIPNCFKKVTFHLLIAGQ